MFCSILLLAARLVPFKFSSLRNKLIAQPPPAYLIFPFLPDSHAHSILNKNFYEFSPITNQQHTVIQYNILFTKSDCLTWRISPKVAFVQTSLCSVCTEKNSLADFFPVWSCASLIRYIKVHMYNA